MEYIDCRGVWPTYVNGMKTTTLVGAKHDITLEEAKKLVSIIPEVFKKEIDKDKWTEIWNDSIVYWTKWLVQFPKSIEIVNERIRDANAWLAKLQ